MTGRPGRQTVTRFVTDDRLADYGDWFDNQRRLRQLTGQLERSAWPSSRPTHAGTKDATPALAKPGRPPHNTAGSPRLTRG
jgi:hypothetical protein